MKSIPSRLSSLLSQAGAAAGAWATTAAWAVKDLPGGPAVNQLNLHPPVTKIAGDLEWKHLKPPVLAAIMDYYVSGQALEAGAGAKADGEHGEGAYEGDTAQIVAEIKDLAASGLLDGVTTNPSLIHKSGRQMLDVIKEICAIVPGPVSAETVATDHKTMLEEGRKLAKLAKNVAVKVPLTPDGLKTCKALAAEGTMVNVTLCCTSSCPRGLSLSELPMVNVPGGIQTMPSGAGGMATFSDTRAASLATEPATLLTMTRYSPWVASPICVRSNRGPVAPAKLVPLNCH